MPAKDVFEVVACGLRPEGSFGHLAVLVAFVLAAARLAPTSRRSSERR
jgi:hypothetical protein